MTKTEFKKMVEHYDPRCDATVFWDRGLVGSNNILLYCHPGGARLIQRVNGRWSSQSPEPYWKRRDALVEKYRK